MRQMAKGTGEMKDLIAFTLLIIWATSKIAFNILWLFSWALGIIVSVSGILDGGSILYAIGTFFVVTVISAVVGIFGSVLCSALVSK